MQEDIAIVKALREYIVYKTKQRDEVDINKIAREHGCLAGDVGYPFSELNQLRYVNLDAVIKACELVIALV